MFHGTLFSHVKEGPPAIGNNMDTPWAHCAKWDKSEKSSSVRYHLHASFPPSYFSSMIRPGFNIAFRCCNVLSLPQSKTGLQSLSWHDHDLDMRRLLVRRFVEGPSIGGCVVYSHEEAEDMCFWQEHHRNDSVSSSAYHIGVHDVSVSCDWWY